MRELDRHFANVGIPIAARELAAVAEAGFDQGQESVRVPDRREPAPGKYTGEDLLLHAARWFVNTYPEQTKIDSSLGSTVVSLRGQLWEYRVPLGGGRYLLHAGDPDNGPATIATPNGYPLIPAGNPVRALLPHFCLIKGIVDFPHALAEGLSDAEQYQIIHAFCRGQLAYIWLTRARKHDFVRGAIGDFASAVHHLLRSPVELGLSRWASLQGVEKVVKSYIAHAGSEVPTRGRAAHSLAELAKVLRESGGPDLTEQDLSKVQCPAAVRYDATGQTMEAAVEAHYAALDLVKVVATELCKRHPLPTTPGIGDEIEIARDMADFVAERAGLHHNRDG